MRRLAKYRRAKAAFSRAFRIEMLENAFDNTKYF
jgi:hypothetical protein